MLVAFVDLLSFGLIIPLLPVYAKRLDASGLTLGCLIGSYSLMQLIFNPLLGRWSDRVGRRRILLFSVGGSVISHVMLGVADLWVSLPLLFAARLFDGITGANIATAQAYIADVTSAKDRAKGMGLFGAAFGMGFVLGPGAAFARVNAKLADFMDLDGMVEWRGEDFRTISSTERKSSTSATRAGVVFVQVMATPDKSEAERLKKKLSGKGYDALTVPVEAGRTKLYRVRVRAADLAEARAVSLRLKNEEGLVSWIAR